MKLALWLAAGLSWGVALLAPTPNREVTVLIAGDLNGYLAPCGCTKPMQGGIRRMAGAVAAIRQSGSALLFFNGNISGGIGRQQELKAETVAESLRLMKTSGFNLTAADARLGAGVVSAMQRLSGGKLLSAHFADSGTVRGRVAGAFWVVGISEKANQMARSLAEQDLGWRSSLADSGNRPIIVLYDGGRSGAEALARAEPNVKLIVYSAPGRPATVPTRIGGSLLVHPGEQGKWLLRLGWNGKIFIQKATVSLGPEIAEDQAVAKVYQNYLARVGGEKLLEQLPRSSSSAFAGTKKCGSCHVVDLHVWQDSAHAGALETLERDGHDRDPDCVSCHVVGLDKTGGFMSRSLTPDLADVGCESCHGAGADHSMAPAEHRMGKIGAAACMKCHVPAHSPNFKYDSYWLKIQHGVEK